NRCHRQNMKTSIINGSEVSRLSVAIHIYEKPILAGVDTVSQQGKGITSGKPAVFVGNIPFD
ncbi:hypothetical protein PO658_20610, partial [Enterobacter roggenkampii]|uniref:hypothetical protein n=1 Tax=Enterobacter roggenkampii TaxID=1812935 RepID=UPI002FF5173F